ncbi:lysophosphatidylserine lipase ABHD12-like isoform X1 [Homalodisca vitripennis]|uniref:lysophosphatidylserine lipase ABHD12-like isoform X1 n=1 Tax=Homalodisca vitripennis TaxID=197043 RepID=UPI001EECDCA5|nr:lysophosphatidylserine lipase ABHD12-like isoform X1 [Homalodisca vitripennis]
MVTIKIRRGHRFFSATYLPHHRTMNIFFKRRFVRRICLGTFIFALLCFFFIFVVVPLIFRYSYDMQRGLLFLNFVKVHNADYNKPTSAGLIGARSLNITTKDGVRLGVWHTLPVKHQLEALAATWLTDRAARDQRYDSWMETGVTVVYCHGNAGDRTSDHRIKLYQILNQLNYHVIAFDYRGYADSDNLPIDEQAVVEDTRAILTWVRERVTKGNIFVWGHSLGTAIAAHTLAVLEGEGKKVAGVVLEAPFNNLSEEIREYPISQLFTILPWFDFCFVEPVYENNLRFESDVNLRNVSVPLLFLHAEDDRVVPFKLGRKLHESVLRHRKENNTVDFIRFERKLGYGHKFIYRDRHLPMIVRKFVEKSLQKS